MKIFINGNWCSSSEAHLSAFDRGFLFGDGVFTTIKVEESRPLFLDHHVNRLRTSCRFFSIQFPEDLSFPEIIGMLLKRNQLTDARVKIVVTRGNDPLNQVTNYPSQTPTVVVFAFPLATSSFAPLSLSIADTVRGTEPVYHHKTTSYLQNLWYKTMARQQGFDDCIMVDHRGFICETTTANVFFMQGNVVITPPADLPLLDGIMRQQLVACGTLGEYSIREEYLTTKDLESIDAAFTTSAIVEICPIKEIDGRPLPVQEPEILRRKWVEFRHSI